MKGKKILVFILFLFMANILFAKKVVYLKEQEYIYETKFSREEMHKKILLYLNDKMRQMQPADKFDFSGTAKAMDKRQFNSMNVILDDKDENVIAINIQNLYLDSTMQSIYHLVDFDCKIYFKDYKYRFLFTNISVKGIIYYEGNGYANVKTDKLVKINSKLLDILNEKLEGLAKNFNDYIEKDKKEEW